MSQSSFTGTITDVFAHRFVIETREGRFLADIGPKAAEHISLKAGLKVRIEGERKPSEIKVERIAIGEGEFQPAHHPGPDHHHHDFSAKDAVLMAQAEGYKIAGDLHPKKKHYEASATKGGRSYNIHIHRDGVHVH